MKKFLRWRVVDLRIMPVTLLSGDKLGVSGDKLLQALKLP